MTTPVLSLEGLHLAFGERTVVDGLDLTLQAGESLALVGESGCGKTVTALSTLRLLPPPGRITAGRIILQGRDITTLPERELDTLRGGAVGTIWQDPLAALNPVLPVGLCLEESLRQHRGLTAHEARTRAIALLGQVGLAQPERRLHLFPHQLSGGQRQRVMIAAAIACDPVLLLADEPTTALDTSVQAQILELLRRLCTEQNMAMLLITHDLGVVAQVADRVAVMYAGQIVEEAPVPTLFAHPGHPYTQGLLGATPRLDGTGMPVQIPGQVPAAGRWPSGCRFKTRCPLYSPPTCDTMPLLGVVADGAGDENSRGKARCWFAGTPAWKPELKAVEQ